MELVPSHLARVDRLLFLLDFRRVPICTGHRRREGGDAQRRVSISCAAVISGSIASCNFFPNCPYSWLSP